MKHVKSSVPKDEDVFFTKSECKSVLNIRFACLAYEVPQGELFKKQARELIEKIQPIIDYKDERLTTSTND